MGLTTTVRVRAHTLRVTHGLHAPWSHSSLTQVATPVYTQGCGPSRPSSLLVSPKTPPHIASPLIRHGTWVMASPPQLPRFRRESTRCMNVVDPVCAHTLALSVQGQARPRQTALQLRQALVEPRHVRSIQAALRVRSHPGACAVHQARVHRDAGLPPPAPCKVAQALPFARLLLGEGVPHRRDDQRAPVAEEDGALGRARAEGDTTPLSVERECDAVAVVLAMLGGEIISWPR